MNGSRTYFVQVRRWCIMVDGPDLAADLRQLLSSRSMHHDRFSRATTVPGFSGVGSSPF
jgi:hypothetical protein